MQIDVYNALPYTHLYGAAEELYVPAMCDEVFAQLARQAHKEALQPLHLGRGGQRRRTCIQVYKCRRHDRACPGEAERRCYKGPLPHLDGPRGR